MVPPRVSGPLGTADQQLPHRLCSGENLQGESEKAVCAGNELLFLSRRSRLLSHRFPSGGHRELELQIRFLCGWVSGLFGGAGGTVRLRLAMSFRTDSGSAAQDPFSKETPDLSGRQAAAQAEVCDSGGFRHSAAHVSGGCDGSGRTVFLQADLSGRDAGGRHPSGADEQIHAQCSGLAVRLEKCPARSHHSALHHHLPAFLQVHLPSGGHLLRIQPHLCVQIPGG